jgi:arylsulfatase A
MSKPNVVMIVADDLGSGDLSFFNHGLTDTPGIDRLFREGLHLSQSYSGSAVCAPARAALMTGRYPHRTGVIDTLACAGHMRLNPAEATLGDCFKQAGYVTGLFGKWHLGASFAGCMPHQRGFDEAAIFDPSFDYWDYTWNVNGRFVEHEGKYLTEQITDGAVDFLRRHRDEPFLLCVTHFAPHQPLHAPQAAIDKFLSRGLDERLATLYAMIECLDAGVGRLLESIDELGLAEDTIVLFASDNGPQFCGPGGPSAVQRFNLGLRGHKDLVYEGGIRVPLAIRWPGGIQGGRAEHCMTHFADWLPTLCAACGIADNLGLALDGQNLLPVLQQRGPLQISRRFWQFSRTRPVPTHNAAVREDQWKLVRPSTPTALKWHMPDLRMHCYMEKHPEEFRDAWPDHHVPDPQLEQPAAAQLFNLAWDPQETCDLAAGHPDRVSKMIADLETWFEDVERDRQAIATPPIVSPEKFDISVEI